MSRLRTRSAAPWARLSTPKLSPGGIQHCQPAPSSSSRAVLWPYCAASYWQPGGRAPRAPRRAHGSQSSNEYCRLAASRLPGGSTRLARRAPADLAAAPAAAALAAAALAGERYDRRRPLHPRLPSRAPSRRARPTLLAHGTRRHSAAENRRCSARSARDLVLSRLDPARPGGLRFSAPTDRPLHHPRPGIYNAVLRSDRFGTGHRLGIQNEPAGGPSQITDHSTHPLAACIVEYE